MFASGVLVEVVEDFLGVVGWFYFVEAVDDFAFWVDEVGGARYSHVFAAVH